MEDNNLDEPSNAVIPVRNPKKTENLSQSWSEKEKYKTANDRLSLHGQYYALQLLILFFFQGKNCGARFRLASEQADAIKFDDLVFCYEKGGRRKYRFLQAKHCHSDGKELIKISDLKSDRDKNDFSLQQYFVSYIKIIENDEFKDGDIQDLIICTNSNFSFISREHNDKNHEKWKRCLIEKTVEDNILNLGGKLYQFSTDIIDEIKDVFEKALERNKLIIDPDVLRDKIGEFLMKLFFAVEQPSEESLEKKIKENMNESGLNPSITYERFFKEMFKWMQKYENNGKIKEATYLTHENWREWVNEAKSDIATLSYTEKIKKYKTMFIEEIDEFKEMREFLESQRQILIIHTKYALLSEIKVWQVVEHKELDFIFWDLSSQECSEMEAFKNISRNLLIITGCNPKDKGNALNGFFKILKEHSKKKIILISSEEVPDEWFKEMSIDEITMKIKDNGNHFKDLIPESRENLFKKIIVKFQGEEIKLSKLVESDIKYIFGEVLCKIIQDEKIVIGTELMDSKYRRIKDCYIERKFIRHLNVNEDFKKKDSDFFIINSDNLRGKSGLIYTQDILLISDEEYHFMRLCDQHKYHNIHRLREIGNNFVWQQSRGNLSKIREIIIKNDQNTSLHELSDIARTIDKEVIVTAEPGMGKSTVLTHLAVQTKKSDPSLWIFKINLVDNLRELGTQERFNEEKAAVKFLYRIVGSQLILKIPEETEEENNARIENFLSSISVKDNRISIEDNETDIDDISWFKVNLFNKHYNEGKIIFLFDGFDEISPDCGTKVKELLKVLKGTEAKIWVTTRPYNITDELENALGVFSYSLKGFSKDDQEEYLQRFWNISLDRKPCKIFINELLSKFSKSTEDIERNFVSNPLQIYMLAKIFKNIFLEWYDSNEEGLSEEYRKKFERITLVSLYKEFINIKYNEIWCKDKYPELSPETHKFVLRKENEEKKVKCLEKHRKLAAYALLGPNEIELFLSEHELREIPRIIEEVKYGEEKVGIITSIDNNKPLFVHLTFAEYFLFDFIQKKLFSSEVTKEIWEFVLNKIFMEDKFNVVCRFFNDYLQTESVEVGHDQSELIKIILRKVKRDNSHQSLFFGIYSPTPLCVASEKGLEGITEFLLKHQPDNYYNISDSGMRNYIESSKSSVDSPTGKYVSYLKRKIHNYANAKGFKGTALYRAVENNHKRIVEMLLRNHAYVTPISLHRFTNPYPLNYFIEERLEIFEILFAHLESNGLKEWLKEIKRNDGRSLLHLAVLNENCGMVRRLINKGADVNVKDCFGNTPLRLAVDYNKDKIFNILIRNNADVNCKDNVGYTPLHVAIMHYNMKFVHILIQNADVNCADNDGNTPLHFAAKFSFEEVVDVLLKNGANVNAMNSDGKSPLRLAVDYNKDKIVNILIRNIADVNCKDNEGHTPLHVAIMHYNKKLVHILIQNADVNCADNEGNTPLHLAAKFGLEKVVNILLKNDADANAVNIDGKTPIQLSQHWDVIYSLIEVTTDVNYKNDEGYTQLHLAAIWDKDKFIRALIRKNADVDCKDYNLNTPLHFAVKYNSQKVIHTLLEENADVNSEDNEGNTPLHLAVHFGKEEIIDILLRKATSVNIRNTDGNTPLHIAVKYGRGKIVDILYTKGAGINAVNSDGNTPLHLAVQYGHGKIVDILYRKGASVNAVNCDGNTPLHLAVQYGRGKIVDILHRNGAIVNAENSDGNTPLHLAVQNGRGKIVDILHRKGAGVNAVNSDGNTPLHLAVQYGHGKIVDILYRKGASVNVSNTDGNTPLHLAVQYGHGKIVDILHRKGAIVNAVNCDGNTPLHLAVQYGRGKIVDVLHRKGAGVNAVNSDGNTPLHLAVQYGRGKIVDVLHRKGAGVNAVNSDGNTPLHLAVQYGRGKIVDILHRNGAIVNAMNTDGNTPLHIAAKYGREKIVDILHTNGASVNAVNSDGDTPFDFAVQHNHLLTIFTLIKNTEESILSITLEDRINDAKMEHTLILNKTVDYNSRNNFAETALDLA